MQSVKSRKAAWLMLGPIKDAEEFGLAFGPIVPFLKVVRVGRFSADYPISPLIKLCSRRQGSFLEFLTRRFPEVLGQQPVRRDVWFRGVRPT
jgi:hypothetical protein